MDESWYQMCLNDMEIARKEIRDMKLFLETGVLCELYALPSHNLQTYYAVIYEDEEVMKMVYAKSLIQVWQYSEPIRMYTFEDAKEADNHPGYAGKIIVGMKRLNEELSSLITDILDSNLDRCCPLKNGFCLDGVRQAITIYKNGKAIRNIIYREADEIKLDAEKEYLREELNNLYMTVNAFIETP